MLIASFLQQSAERTSLAIAVDAFDPLERVCPCLRPDLGLTINLRREEGKRLPTAKLFFVRLFIRVNISRLLRRTSLS